ncbi:DUF3450 family protein [Robiginitomaculum antarcticum]|uniref:DUF3450 family protein n=1 Tax=Robiginitomaculum antarcticum TaxID=437507 RepID=UPI0003A7AC13|nr:DUF3450 family protein [Robiginitomaculum antarcticum]
MKLHPSALRICAVSVALLTAAPLLSGSALAQTASLSADYAQTLQNIENTKFNIARTEMYIAGQERKIAELQALIANTPKTNADIEAMLPRAVTQVGRVINSDVPFRIEERRARLDKLRETVENAEIAPTEKYRSLLSLLKIETEYGQTVDWYEADRPLNEGETPVLVPVFEDDPDAPENSDAPQIAVMDPLTGEQKLLPETGYFVHYGRLSLAYLSTDATYGRRWNTETKMWDDLSASELNDVRFAVRMARGETAPSVLTADVRLPEGE